MKRCENFGVVRLGRFDPPTYRKSENEVAGCQMAESDFSPCLSVNLQGKGVKVDRNRVKIGPKFFGQKGGGRAYFNMV